MGGVTLRSQWFDLLFKIQKCCGMIGHNGTLPVRAQRESYAKNFKDAARQLKDLREDGCVGIAKSCACFLPFFFIFLAFFSGGGRQSCYANSTSDICRGHNLFTSGHHVGSAVCGLLPGLLDGLFGAGASSSNQRQQELILSTIPAALCATDSAWCNV